VPALDPYSTSSGVLCALLLLLAAAADGIKPLLSCCGADGAAESVELPLLPVLSGAPIGLLIAAAAAGGAAGAAGAPDAG
jgi:hypothetical protein